MGEREVRVYVNVIEPVERASCQVCKWAGHTDTPHDDAAEHAAVYEHQAIVTYIGHTLYGVLIDEPKATTP